MNIHAEFANAAPWDKVTISDYDAAETTRSVCYRKTHDLLFRGLRGQIHYRVMFLLAYFFVSFMPTDSALAEWAEWTYQWEKLTIVIKTNAGVYSPSLQARSIDGSNTSVTSPGKLLNLAEVYFVSTSAARVDHTFDFITTLARHWGAGHALPVIAAVAIENLQRPVPTLFGGMIQTLDSAERKGGEFDPNRPGILRITVHSDPAVFRHTAQHFAHTSAKAYYDGRRNEVGVFLDMSRFRKFYGLYDKSPEGYPAVFSAFIAYVMDTFNEDSSHELAHAYQQQNWQLAYTLLAIREGEAEVQGMTRRRNGLLFSFLYNTPDFWYTGRFDNTTIMGRLKTLRGVGRPMSPMEIDRLRNLKALRDSGRWLSTSQLLSMDAPSFFTGSPEDIESHYAQAWALCLLAIRDELLGAALVQAVEGRLANKPRIDIESRLDDELKRFIGDPNHLVVTKDRAWKDAERFYEIDPIFVGVFYTWIYSIDPDDMKALIYLGDALYRGHNLHSAMEYYLAAHQRNLRSALPLLRIGDIQRDVGDRDSAIRSWREATATSETGEDETMYRLLAEERPTLKTKVDP